MTDTWFCDSSSVRALVLAHKKAAAVGTDAAVGTEFRVAVSSGEVLRIIAITRLDTVLRIYPSAEEALAGGMR